MKAWLTARRVKSGHEEDFRRKWRGGDTPEGMVDAFLLEDEQDPRETLSLSLWDTAQNLLAYRTGEEAKKREETISDVVDKVRWSRSFVAWNPWDINTSGGKKKWAMLPLLLAGAGAAAFYVLKKRGGKADEWDSWEPEPADRYQPDVAPTTATAANASPSTPPPAVRPLDTTTRAGISPAPQVPASLHATPSAQRTAEAGLAPPPAAGPGATRAAVHGNPVTQRASEMAATSTPRAGNGGSATATSPSPAAGQQGRGRTVREFMTVNPETVSPNTDAATAALRMRTLDVGVLPVVADGSLAGIITDRDLALGVSAREAPPNTVRVGDLMSHTPHTIAPHASVEAAAKLMADHQVRRLPVVEGNRLVGIIALGDIAAEGGQNAAATALQEISEPAEPTR